MTTIDQPRALQPAKLGAELALVLATALAAISACGIALPSTYARETAAWAAQAVGQDWFDLLIAVPWLVLVARRQERLDEIADDLRAQYTVGVDVQPLDLSDAGAREQLAKRLRTEPIAGLCNSAGFGTWIETCVPPEMNGTWLIVHSMISWAARVVIAR